MQVIGPRGSISKAILSALVQARGNFVTASALMSAAWDEPAERKAVASPHYESLRVLVRRLRLRGYRIESRRGCGAPGYRLMEALS